MEIGLFVLNFWVRENKDCDELVFGSSPMEFSSRSISFASTNGRSLSLRSRSPAMNINLPISNIGASFLKRESWPVSYTTCILKFTFPLLG